jgi:hypothetical protein
MSLSILSFRLSEYLLRTQLPRNVRRAVLSRAPRLHRATFAIGTHLNQLTPFLRRTAALESTETLQLGRVDKPQAGSP